MNTAFKVLKNSIALWLAVLLERLFSFVLTVYIARVLGVSSLGEYTLVLSFMLIFQTLALFGQDEIIMREVARDRSKAGIYLVNSSLIAVLSSIAFSIVMNITANLLGYAKDIIVYIYVVSFALIPGTLSLVAEAVVKALEKMEYVTAVRFGGSLLNAIASLILLQLGHRLTTVFALMSVVQLMMFTLYLFCVNRLAGKLSFQIDIKFCKSLSHVSGIFLLINVFGIVLKKIDVIMLSKIEGSEAVGVYAAAGRLVQTGQMISAAYTLSVIPSMSQSFVTSKEKFVKIAEQSLKLFLIIVVPIAFGVTALADKVIFLIYGPEYIDSIAVLQILIWTLVLLAVNSVMFRALIASNNEKITVRVVGIKMIVCIILNFLLIPRYGVIGASIAWVSTVVLGLLLNYYFVSRNLFRIDFAQVAGRPFLGAMIAGGGLLWLRWIKLDSLLLFGAAVYACLYFILLIILRVLSREELLFLRQLWRVATGTQSATLE